MIPFYSDKEDKDFRDVAGAMASAFNTLRFEPDKGLDTALQTIKQQRTANRAKNKTVEYLRSLGQPEATRLANMVETGQLTGQQAYSQIFALEQEKRAADRAAANAARSFENQVKLLEMRQGYSTDAANLANTRAIELAELTNELAMKRDAAKPVKASTFEKKVLGYMASGMPEDMAIGFASGRLTTETNSTTGQTFVFDNKTGQPYQTSQVNTQQVGPSDDIDLGAGRFDEIQDINAALGGRGWAANIANTITDAVSMGQLSPAAGEASAAMKQLQTRTALMAGIDIEGKPSNFTRQEIKENLTISPNQISTGPEAAHDTAVEMRNLLAETFKIAKRNAADNSPVSVEQRRIAADSLPNLETLLRDYDSLVRALERAGAGGSAPSALSAEDRSLVDKYKN